MGVKWGRRRLRMLATYLKYNRCLPGTGFQRFAAQALALLRTHRDYRLIVDLRDNGGVSGPFRALLDGLGSSVWSIRSPTPRRPWTSNC